MCMWMTRPSTLYTALALLIGVVFASAGCSASTTPPTRSVSQAPSPSAASVASPAGQTGAGQASADQPDSDRMIIRNISLFLVVEDVEAALTEISRVADDLQGYVLSADSNEVDGRRVGKASIRVPSSRVDEGVGRIKGLAQRVQRETNSAKDVTEEYVDQDAHLRNLQATEEQYRQILKTATTMDQIITVNKSISDVRDQIERTQGRLQFLRRSAEMATISVDLQPSAVAQSVHLGEWEVGATVRQALRSLIAVVQVLVTLVIWVAAFAPIWLPLAIVYLWWRRRQAPRSAAPPTGAV